MTKQTMPRIRHTLRLLARSPGFSLTVIVTLALGIGVNSAVFSALDAIVLRPLAFVDGDRLVSLNEVYDGVPENVGLLRLEDWNRLSTTLEAISGYAEYDASDTTTDVSERIRAAGAAPRLLEVLRVTPALGRDFTDEEFLEGNCARLVSDRYWRTRLGADPNVLGRPVRVNNAPCPVVGVLPAGFSFPNHAVDVWTTMPVDAPYEGRTTFSSYRIGIARLKPGVTLEQAHADLSLVQQRLAEQYPDTDRGIEIQIAPLKDVVLGGAGQTLWLLFGAVSMVLLVACTNLAALLLARGARREEEIALRYSLGATRSAVVSQMLAEVAVLALTGAALGVLVAAAGSTVLRLLAPELPRLAEVGLDVRTLFYATALAVLVTLLCGLFPALRSARSPGAVVGGGRAVLSSRQSIQWSLAGAQIALSLTLLAGAGLLLRSFDEIARVDSGFDLDRVLAFRTSAVYDEPADRWAPRIGGWLDELSALPGVESAAASFLMLPGVPVESAQEFRLADAPSNGAEALVADWRVVSPDYFATMGVPLLAGDVCRAPAEAGGESAVSAMVNRRFADRYLVGRPVVGLELARTIPAEFGGVSVTRVVGIVGDARERGRTHDPVPTVYQCGTLDPNPWFVVRTGGDPSQAAGSVRAKMRELAPLRPVYPIAPLESLIDDVYATDRLRTVLLTAFAISALSLACLGVYATLSYAVTLRHREVGVRVALGALSRNIVAQFLLKAFGVVAAACLVGLALSLALARALAGMLYGVSPWDPATFVAAVLVVGAVAGAAALIPALRAARADPMQALRAE